MTPPLFRRSKLTYGKGSEIFLPFIYHRSAGIFLFLVPPLQYSILCTTAIRNRESISKKGLTVGIFVIWYSAVSNIGELGEGTEREGFEPSVNKSLHSSSNATPWTTRPSLLHNDYDPETEWIASHLDYWIGMTNPILTLNIRIPFF